MRPFASSRQAQANEHLERLAGDVRVLDEVAGAVRVDDHDPVDVLDVGSRDIHLGGSGELVMTATTGRMSPSHAIVPLAVIGRPNSEIPGEPQRAPPGPRFLLLLVLRGPRHRIVDGDGRLSHLEAALLQVTRVRWCGSEVCPHRDAARFPTGAAAWRGPSARSPVGPRSTASRALSVAGSGRDGEPKFTGSSPPTTPTIADRGRRQLHLD